MLEVAAVHALASETKDAQAAKLQQGNGSRLTIDRTEVYLSRFAKPAM